MLPDPPSERGIVYPKDPSIVLDDVIVRPASAPPPPAAAAPAAPAASAADLMEVDDALVLPAVPLNQQRKEAIRAKQAGGEAGAGSGGAAGAMPRAADADSAASIAEALHAANLDGRSAPASGIRAAPSPGSQGGGGAWLAAVFGKQGRRPEAGDAGGLLAAGPPSAGSYLQHHLRQQQQQQQQLPLSMPAGDGGSKAATLSGGGRPVFNLTASSGTAAGLGDHLTPVDMRPSVTVRG